MCAERASVSSTVGKSVTRSRTLAFTWRYTTLLFNFAIKQPHPSHDRPTPGGAASADSHDHGRRAHGPHTCPCPGRTVLRAKLNHVYTTPPPGGRAPKRSGAGRGKRTKWGLFRGAGFVGRRARQGGGEHASTRRRPWLALTPRQHRVLTVTAATDCTAHGAATRTLVKRLVTPPTRPPPQPPRPASPAAALRGDGGCAPR